MVGTTSTYLFLHESDASGRRIPLLVAACNTIIMGDSLKSLFTVTYSTTFACHLSTQLLLRNNSMAGHHHTWDIYLSLGLLSCDVIVTHFLSIPFPLARALSTTFLGVNPSHWQCLIGVGHQHACIEPSQHYWQKFQLAYNPRIVYMCISRPLRRWDSSLKVSEMCSNHNNRAPNTPGNLKRMLDGQNGWQKLHSHVYTRATVCSFVSFTHYLIYLRRQIAKKIRLWHCLLHRSFPSHSW
jgi:hypothetical protein